LITDIIALLAEKGITANPDPDRAAPRQRAASELLSGLCVIPTLAPEVALDLDGHAHYNAKFHGD
jgi:hypothetical protein